MGSNSRQSQASPPHSVIGRDKSSASEIVSQWKKSFNTLNSKSIENISSQIGSDPKKSKRDLAPLARADTKRTKKQKMADKDLDESRSKNRRKTSSGYAAKVKVLHSGTRLLFPNLSTLNFSIQFKTYSLNSFAFLKLTGLTDFYHDN